jgi:HlyD family secretion protein
VTKSIQPNRKEDISGIEAAFAQAKANVKDAEAALIQAKENLKNAVTNVSRYKELKDSGVVSVQEFENRETTARVNEAMVRGAQERVNAAVFGMKQYSERMHMAHVGGRREDIDIARASVAEIQGNVKRLQTQIDQTFIKAPVDGMIARRDTHLGDISTAGKVMFYMARDNRLELRAQVPEADLKSVKPGESVSIDSALTENGKITGRVREISPLVDADTRQATVRIDVPTQSGLKAGMYAEGHINVGEIMALTVPAQAVISRDEKHSLFIVHGDQVESRLVTEGNRNSNFVQISSGLTAQDRVVLDGGGFLKDGDCVTVAPLSGANK